MNSALLNKNVSRKRKNKKYFQIEVDFLLQFQVFYKQYCVFQKSLARGN